MGKGTVIKRRLYKRGSSFETTIPKPMLFARDLSKRQNVLFKYDSESNRWYVEFEDAGAKEADPSGERGEKEAKAHPGGADQKKRRSE